MCVMFLGGVVDWGRNVGMSSLSYIPFVHLHVTDEFVVSVLLAHKYQIPIIITRFDIFIATSSCQREKKGERKKNC